MSATPPGSPAPEDPVKPANPEPTAAPVDPEKNHADTPDPEQGKSEHPKQ